MLKLLYNFVLIEYLFLRIYSALFIFNIFMFNNPQTTAVYIIRLLSVETLFLLMFIFLIRILSVFFCVSILYLHVDLSTYLDV